MGLEIDKLMVNEAACRGLDAITRPFRWLFSISRLGQVLHQTCCAYFRIWDEHAKMVSELKTVRELNDELRKFPSSLAERIRSALMLPPDPRATPASLLETLLAKHVEADNQARVATRKMHENIDEHNKAISKLRDDDKNALAYIKELEQSRGEFRDGLRDANEAIRVKDEALLAAAERIKGQSEILTAAAARPVQLGQQPDPDAPRNCEIPY